RWCGAKSSALPDARRNPGQRCNSNISLTRISNASLTRITGVRDFLLDAADRAFREEVRAFLARELAPRAAAIEERDDWNAIQAVVAALGDAGYLRLMFRDLYRGSLAKPGLTHATILSEEASYLNYAF